MRENKGITLIALTVTIIILLILAGITISGGNESIKMSKSNRLTSELDMVQHACLERYTEYKLTKKSSLLVGTQVEYSVAQNLASTMGHTSDFPAEGEGTYYRLSSANLEDLGLKQSEDTYIVNYEKGIVMNETTNATATGIYLYKSTN
ncbi:MAG: hypothetical protein IKF17_05020 [Clostridia bacterium]|nr:hypothetical protein [Clostridia bacterium]